jgi:hypothetical protein
VQFTVNTEVRQGILVSVCDCSRYLTADELQYSDGAAGVVLFAAEANTRNALTTSSTVPQLMRWKLNSFLPTLFSSIFLDTLMQNTLMKYLTAAF